MKKQNSLYLKWDKFAARKLPNHRLSLFLALVLVLTALLTTYLLFRHSRVEPGKAQTLQTLGRMPLSFEANQGQTDDQVRFLSRGSGYGLFLTPTEAVLALRKSSAAKKRQVDFEPTIAQTLPETAEKEEIEQAVLRMQLVGANAAPRMVGEEELPGKSNYFLGNDPTHWRTNVPSYTKVRYEAVYPGVDLVYYGNQRQLEYDFVVAPGADPAVISFGFAGAETLAVNAEGELVIELAGEQVRIRKPVIYQQRDSRREEIAGGYVLLPTAAGAGEGLPRVSFQLGAYDTGRSLVIDPVLAYSTYLGGMNTSGFLAGHGIDIAVDAGGNAYVAGRTVSPIFPTVNAVQSTFGGLQDAFVAKLDVTGALVYSTYLGGSNYDSARNLSVDTSGNAYVTGYTYSPNFPTVNAVQSTFGGGFSSDVFVTKLNAAGAFVYSTFLGGSREDFLELFGGDFAVDPSGNAYLMGSTASPNFPVVNAVQSTFGGGSQDIFVTKLDAAGAFVYSTYLGGGGRESPGEIAVDGSGNAYVMGSTASSNFPTVNAAQPTFGGSEDIFVTKLNATGAFVYSSYLGGGSFEFFYGNIAVDRSGNAYVTGSTASSNFPTVNAAQPTFGGIYDVFVTKLNSAGAFVYSTYLGGSGGDSIAFGGLVVDGSGNASVVGFTASTNFPTVNAAQPAFGGSNDFFVTKLNSAGAFVYSTYLGGSGGESGANGSIDVALDGGGNLYVHGATASPNFPTVNAAQPTFGGGGNDVFVTKLDATGAFVYSTYLGGGGGENAFYPGLAVDMGGNAYVTGSTSSPNFPVVNAVQSTFGGSSDVFATKLDATGALVYSTYLGGSGSESISDTGLVVDTSGNVYLTGNTTSSNFPLQNAAQSTFGDIFVAKISPNQPPTTDAGGPYNVGEGGSVTVAATGNDPENGPLTYAWDLDNNGTFETSGQSVTFSAAGLDGPTSRTIQVRVTDNGGLTATDQATVNVLNVRPTASFANTSGAIIKGQSATLAFSNQFDPSAADTTAGFKYSYDCTNDGVFETSDVAAASHACAYPASGAFTARGRIKDRDGGFTDYTVGVVVLTPQQAIGNLIEKVKALVAAGVLNQGQGNALIAKLEAAIQQLDKGNVNPAINQLQAFVNQVNAMINGGTLPAAEGQPLIVAANEIITVLGG